MVTFIRTADLNGVDKTEQALDWAKKTAEYVNGKFGFSDVQVGVEVYGNVGRMHWIGRQDSLEALAHSTQQSQTDQGYQRLLAQGVGLFVAGSVKDTVVLNI
jgi:hypothetical protein